MIARLKGLDIELLSECVQELLVDKTLFHQSMLCSAQCHVPKPMPIDIEIMGHDQRATTYPQNERGSL